MNKNVSRLITFTGKAIVIILLADFLIGSLLEFLQSRTKRGERARAYYAIQESRADVYIFGSSRALYHYDTHVFQDSLNIPVYNAGRSAQTVLYHLPVLKMIMKRNKPKMVILDINENEFVKDTKKYDLLNYLLPYYRNDESVREAMDIVKPGYRYFSWSRTLPYNSSVFSIAARTFLPDASQKDFNGYLSLRGERQKKDFESYDCNAGKVIDPLIIAAYREFVAVCQKNDIKLLVVISPRLTPNNNCLLKDLDTVTAEIERSGAETLSFVDDERFITHPALFYDNAHLNNEGAVRFSQLIARHLKYGRGN